MAITHRPITTVGREHRKQRLYRLLYFSARKSTSPHFSPAKESHMASLMKEARQYSALLNQKKGEVEILKERWNVEQQK